jgi:hypothetical protein
VDPVDDPELLVACTEIENVSTINVENLTFARMGMTSRWEYFTVRLLAPWASTEV